MLIILQIKKGLYFWKNPIKLIQKTFILIYRWKKYY